MRIWWWQCSRQRTSFSAGSGWFWQQNITQVRKSFITQSKLMIFWWNKKFLKAYDLLLLFPKIFELHFGCGPCWPSFCPNWVIEEQFLTTLPIFLQSYNMITQVININSISQHNSREISKKNPWWVELKGKLWPNSTIYKVPLTWHALPLENRMMNIKDFHGAIQSKNMFFCRLQAHEILMGGQQLCLGLIYKRNL